MIEVGLLDAPDCTSLLLERSFGWRDISIDYTGELVAVVGGRALLLVDLPRRRISRCPSDEDLRGVAFAPDGTLYSRSLDNALLAYETIWV